MLKADAKVDSGLLAAITDADEGFMRPGAMPTPAAASSAGAKALLDGLSEKVGWKKQIKAKG